MATQPKTIPTLKSDKDFDNWDRLLKLYLLYHRKAGHIRNDYKELQRKNDETSAAFEARVQDDEAARVDTIQVIMASLSPLIITKMENGGLNMDTYLEEPLNPKKFYDDIKKAITQTSQETAISLTREWVHLSSSKFDSLSAYLDRFHYLRKKLAANGDPVTDNMAAALLFDGLDKQYGTRIDHLRTQFTLQKLTWEELKATVNAWASEAEMTKLMANKKQDNNNNTGNNNPGGSSTSTSAGKEGKPKATKCNSCHKFHPPGKPYHAFCGRCHEGGDDACFKRHPELLKKYYMDRANSVDTGSNDRNAEGENNTMTANSAALTYPSGVNNGTKFTLMTCDDEAQRDRVAADSGCSMSTFNDLKWFRETHALDEPERSLAANGDTMYTSTAGIVLLKLARSDGNVSTAEFEAIYNPSSPFNLVSMGQLHEAGIGFDTTKGFYIKATGQEAATFTWHQNVPWFNVVNTPTSFLLINYEIMHHRFMHASPERTIKACRDAGIRIDEKQAKEHHCQWCAQGKSVKIISHDSLARPTRALAEVYVDTIQHTPRAKSSFQYAVHMIDRFSNYQWIFFTRTKDEIYAKFTQWINYIEKQTGLEVLTVQLDNGREFNLVEFMDFSTNCGIQMRCTVAYANEQNGPIERAGRQIMDLARTSLLHQKLGEENWPYAEEAAVHVINCLPSKGNDGKSPHEIFAQATRMPPEYINPPVKHLRTFGCRAYVHANPVQRPQGRKMMAKAFKGRMFGYEGHHGKIYRIRLDDEGRIIRARDVKFHEAGVPDEDDTDNPIHVTEFEEDEVILPVSNTQFDSHRINEINNTPPNSDNSDIPSEHEREESDQDTSKETEELPTPSPTPSLYDEFFDTEESDNLVEDDPLPNPETGRQKRSTRKDINYDVTTAKGYANNVKRKNALLAYQPDVYEPQAPDPPMLGVAKFMKLLTFISTVTTKEAPYLPKSYREARKRADFEDQWLPAMQKQLDTLNTKGTWRLETPPPGTRVLDGKWVLDQKFNADSTFLRNRARWVICGNQQEFDETQRYLLYSAVVCATSVRTFLAFVATEDMECEQFDIVAAYLNAHLPDDTKPIYVRQPYGLEDGTKRAFRVLMALYGLRGSAKWWYQTLTPELAKLGFLPLASDLCCFRHTDGTLLLVYVDDILIAAPTKAKVAAVKASLAEIFELKDMGDVSVFLGLNVVRDRANRTIYVNQEQYVHKLLKKYDMEGIHSVKTPWPKDLVLPKTWEAPEDPKTTKEYVSQVASLNYLAINTRPDTSYVLSRLSEANKGPSEKHLELLKHFWRYVAGTRKLGLKIGGMEFANTDNLQLQAYGDAAFADDLLTRASTGGHVVFLAGSPVHWKSQKQTIVTISTTEAEFINLSPTARSLLWVADLCRDAGKPQDEPLVIHTDSQNARLAVLNPLQSARTRHIDIRYKWIISRVQLGDFDLRLVKTTDMKADGLTKPLQRIQHAQFVKQLNLAVPPT